MSTNVPHRTAAAPGPDEAPTRPDLPAVPGPAPPGAGRPARVRRRRGPRIPAWLRDRRSCAAQLQAWWYGPTADELRAAWADTRRAPGWMLLGLIVVLWPSSGFSLVPLGAAAGAWMLLMALTHWMRSWWLRRKLRRRVRPVIGLLAFAVLAVQAGVWGWLLAVGVWLVGMAVSDTLRARRRILAWVLAGIARNARVDPAALHVVADEWDRLTPTYLEIAYGADVAADKEPVREGIEQSVQWSLRHAGRYVVEWPAGGAAVQISAAGQLPREVLDRPWGQVPGIVVGATDPETADGVVTDYDPDSGEAVDSLPITHVNPAKEKHYLVVGGSGGGKTNFTRAFIAQGLRRGWFPGGCFIFDGKSSSDYIVFETREGVHCVARTPEEWDANLDPLDQMIKRRFEQDAEYHRGHRGKPDFPRFLIVLDEVQELRSELGKDFDKYLQRWARQVRAANGRLVVATQRPDAKDAIPGAVKELLEYIFVIGYLGPVGAREALDKDWKAVVDEYGAATEPGRGLARLDGMLVRLQTPRLDLPREKPHLEPLYPPQRGATADSGEQHPAVQDEPLPANVVRWAPRPQAPPTEPHNGAESPAQGSGDVDPVADTAPHGIPRVGVGVPSAPPEDRTSSAAPRRRRTV